MDSCVRIVFTHSLQCNWTLCRSQNGVRLNRCARDQESVKCLEHLRSALSIWGLDAALHVRTYLYLFIICICWKRLLFEWRHNLAVCVMSVHKHGRIFIIYRSDILVPLMYTVISAILIYCLQVDNSPLMSLESISSACRLETAICMQSRTDLSISRGSCSTHLYGNKYIHCVTNII